MEAHRLERIDTGEVLSEVIKQGFCPFDTNAYFPDLPGAPASPVFLESDCAGAAWVTSLHMGTSVGWGDQYPWHMVEQSIDLTGIPDGTYRIREIADPFDWFEESDETNNETWIDVEITEFDRHPDGQGGRSSPLNRGPVAEPLTRVTADRSIPLTPVLRY